MALSDGAIIAMARDANPEHDLTAMLPFLSRFAALAAALAAAKEREGCAHLCDEICAVRGVPFYGLPGMKGSAQECAAAIRARGKP